MSQNSIGERTSQIDETKPAVGLVATEENEGELVRTILQATRRGYEVFVTYASETEPEAVELARLLDAWIVEPDRPDAGHDSLVSALASTARMNGHPGLIYQFDVAVPIDYGRSQAALEDRGTDPESISIIPHGVNDMFGDYDYEERPEEEHTVLFFGNVIPAKGIDTLVEAISHVRERVPDVTLVVAGNGRLAKRSRRIVDRHPENFEIHDYFVPNDQVGEFFSRAALVALPYRRQKGGTKGHSGALATAFSFGKPVVASTAGEFPKQVAETGSGEVVPPRDPEALADAIVDLLEDDEKRSRMAENSATQAERLSWDSIADRHLDLYESILEER